MNYENALSFLAGFSGFVGAITIIVMLLHLSGTESKLNTKILYIPIALGIICAVSGFIAGLLS